MWLIIWIIQSFLGATWMVLSKKVVENRLIWNNRQTFISRMLHLIIVVIILNIWILDFNFSTDKLKYYDYILLLISTSWLYITYNLRRTAYANEKVSVLQPFAMLFQVFPVILAFIFIASERANLITFFTALTASFIVIWTSIDFKQLKISKYSLMVLVSSTIKSFHIFSVVYFLWKFNSASFYLVESIVILLISISFIILNKEYSEIKLLTKKYTKLLLITNTIVIFSILLALTMYSALWVVLTSLISLFYLVFVYLLSYLILKEKPSRKDIIVTLFVAMCIIIWVIFKT